MKKEKRTKPQNCFKKYSFFSLFYMFSHFSHCFTIVKTHIFHISKILHFKITCVSHVFHMFNSNYYNPSVAQLAFINVCVKHMSYYIYTISYIIIYQHLNQHISAIYQPYINMSNKEAFFVMAVLGSPLNLCAGLQWFFVPWGHHTSHEPCVIPWYLGLSENRVYSQL